MEKVVNAAVEYVSQEITEVFDEINSLDISLFRNIVEGGANYNVGEADKVIAEARRISARLIAEAGVIRDALNILEMNRGAYREMIGI